MNEQDIICPFCDSEFHIETEDDDAAVAFCPYCGEELDSDDDGDYDYTDEDY